MQTITITTEFIKLQDLMKLADIVGSGGEAKAPSQDGQVLVDGEPCLQRGRKIKPGTIVTFQNKNYSVAYADS